MADHLIARHCDELEFTEWVDDVADSRDLKDCHRGLHAMGDADHVHVNVDHPEMDLVTP